MATANPTDIFQFDVNPLPVQHIDVCGFDSSSTSSQSSLDEKSVNKKRNWTTCLENLMEEAIRKQEILLNMFLKKMEQLEHERKAREEAWRMQDIERINGEHEILVQERLDAATRNATVISLLEKIYERPNILQMKDNPLALVKIANSPELDYGQSSKQSSSRWPKAEVQDLIATRAHLERSCQGNLLKVPLWEEISAAMKKLGWDRSAKRCKEKWENINKYFKKVKESNMMRPEDSKTCPYFHQLDALYKNKMNKINNALSPSYGLRAEDLVMRVVKRSKQPQSCQQEGFVLLSATEDQGCENDDQYNVEGDDDGEGKTGDEVGGGGSEEDYGSASGEEKIEDEVGGGGNEEDYGNDEEKAEDEVGGGNENARNDPSPTVIAVEPEST